MIKLLSEEKNQMEFRCRLFETVCRNATVAIVLLDDCQRCVYMNPAAEMLTGFSLDEVRGKLLHDVLHHTRPDGTPYPREECPIDRAFPESHRQQGEEFLIHKNGNFYPVAYTASPVQEEGSIVGTIIEMRDIRQERASKEALKSETRTLETLNRTGTMLTSRLDLEEIVQAVTDAATELSGAQYGAFFYNRADGQEEKFELYTLSGAPRDAFGASPMPRNTQVFGPIFRGEGPVRVDDITLDPRYGQNRPYNGVPPGHLPVRSYLAVPVISRSGDVLGGLLFGHGRAGVFTERAERIVAGIAAQAAVAIDNAHLFKQAQIEIAERRRGEEIQQLLIDELNHRVKNMLATVQAIAAQTFRNAPDEEKEAFESRLLTLSRAHSLLVRENWQGSGLRDIAAQALQPFGCTEDASRCSLVGDNIRLPPKTALAFAMAFHELATNAAKYGAFSVDGGQVALSWQVRPDPEGDRLLVRWQESGGPPVAPPRRRGFGSRLIEHGLQVEFGGTVQIHFAPAGVVCVVDVLMPDGKTHCLTAPLPEDGSS